MCVVAFGLAAIWLSGCSPARRNAPYATLRPPVQEAQPLIFVSGRATLPRPEPSSLCEAALPETRVSVEREEAPAMIVVRMMSDDPAELAIVRARARSFAQAGHYRTVAGANLEGIDMRAARVDGGVIVRFTPIDSAQMDVLEEVLAADVVAVMSARCTTEPNGA